MKTITYDGSLPAHVRDSAVGTARMPDDGIAGLDRHNPIVADRFPEVSTEHDTVTLAEYWENRCAEQGQQVAPPAEAHPAPKLTPAPVDSFTIDAEILVERISQASYSTHDVAALLDVSPSTILSRIYRGTIEAPRWHSDRRDQHRWSSLQVVEILARKLRRAAA